VALIAAFMTMTAMATDINLPAIPAMMDTLGTSLTLAQLTVTTFFVGFAFGQAVWGPLSVCGCMISATASRASRWQAASRCL
jgi:MFS transporter, DHA1 family, multidrug resistance protein